MKPDLIISYPHHPATGEPLYAGNAVAEQVARDVRRQLGYGDDDLAVDLERLTAIRAVRVNGIPYEFEWSTSGPVTDDDDRPVLGVCEVDPRGLPDTALICVNPELVDGRAEVVLRSATHEMGHGLFEAPAWIFTHRRASEPGLFDAAGPDAPRRVWRTMTPDEGHLAATYPPGSKEFFQETRANEYMGSVLAPRSLLARRFLGHCERAGLDPAAVRPEGGPAPLLSCAAEPAPVAGNLSFLRLGLRNRLSEVVARLAREFHVTRRFIEVRLKRYRLLAEHISIL